MLAPPDPAASRKPLRQARRTVAIAAAALEQLGAQFGEPEFAATFEALVDMVLGCRGRVVLTGLGKSGIVARKIAATFIATGTQSVFLHPGDAGLGDIGIVEPDDMVLVVSRSGNAAELAPVISYCRRFGTPMVMVISSARTTATRFADLTLMLPRVKEAGPVRLSPTTSTTVQLVLGDALATAVMARRGFSQDDFYKFHPSGRLGAQLLKVSDVMTSGAKMPRVLPHATLVDATVEMTRARFGGTAVVDRAGMLVGAFTDGDLRRTFTGGAQMSAPVGEWMTRQPCTLGPREFASEALHRMQGQSIMLLFVVDAEGKLVGIVHMHDLLKAGTA
jgi:arabinose-5-phosphate isomerase